uniref:DUF4797 domain-containing protein n=1 Tax=Glossina pallidipes TaxID=7398 RepID=A0A1B0A6J4_GLOPL
MKASNSNSSSSGCSAASSTTDIKKCRTDIRLSGNRSRSFLHCLSKHLGRHFLHHTSHHHHHHTMHHNGQTIVYNSQEDLRSSSTDSFSLSYERNSHLDCVAHLNGGIGSEGGGGSNLDLSSAERTSRTSSGSACSRFSPETEDLDNSTSYRYSQRHIYLDTSLYRHSSTFNCQNAEDDLSEADSGNSSSDENDDEAQNNKIKGNQKESPSISVSPCCPLTNSSAKGLHLSRISITSSVRSMFQHITSASAAASSRSLSCSSTPLKRVWESKCKKTNSASSNSSNSNKKSSTSIKANSNSNSNNNSNNKKPEKKQQSILRPPISYVYMKGMSGLYSRVPRYTVCCPYGTQQWA